MDLREIRWVIVDWIHVAQDGPVAGSCEHGNETLAYMKGGGDFLSC
jgi:hypothetical protein